MRKKLIELMNFGADIEFSVKGKRYTILAWLDEGIAIGEKGSEDDYVFSTPEELLDAFLIDGDPLSIIVDQVEIEFSTI